MTLQEAVRTRPAMYLGNNGILGLFNEVVTTCIRHCERIHVGFEIVAENDFVLTLSAQQDMSLLASCFLSDPPLPDIFFITLLKAIASQLTIQSNDSSITICFAIDTTILPDVVVDYLKMCEKMSLLALLNRECSILVVDKRQKYLNQIYYHFPQGIFYIFERAMADALGKPTFIVTFDDRFGHNTYQIGIAYRSDWFPAPRTISFANDNHTIYGGSLEIGTIAGIMSACKQYIEAQHLDNHTVTRQKILHGLILVVAVRGKEFQFGGGFRDALADKQVQKEVKALVKKLVFDYLCNSKETTTDFLHRLDTARLFSL